MAKRKRGSKRTRTHPTSRQAASGSRRLENTHESEISIDRPNWETAGERRERLGENPADAISRLVALDNEVEAYYQEHTAATGRPVDPVVRAALIEAVDKAVDEMQADGLIERMSRGRWRRTDYPNMAPATIEELAQKVFPKAFRDPPREYQRWEDAMVAQQRLYEFYGSHVGLAYLAEFEANLNARHRPENRIAPGFQTALAFKTLGEAEPVWVSHDIVELIDHARHSWEIEPVREADPFVGSAFCLLARPIWLDEGDGNHAPIRAIAWTNYHAEDRQTGSHWISLYSHVEDLEPEDAASIDPAVGPLVLVHTLQWQWGTMPLSDDRLDRGPILNDDPELLRHRATQQCQFVQTLWRLAQQFTTAKRRAPRPLRRDYRRKTGRDIDDVTVITLRRQTIDYEEPDGDDPSWHYSVSFLVRGHWRNQPCKEGIRQIWIKPYVKGQGPFKETVRAWEFTR
jgi:hypothetical protein